VVGGAEPKFRVEKKKVSAKKKCGEKRRKEGDRGGSGSRRSSPEEKKAKPSQADTDGLWVIGKPGPPRSRGNGAVCGGCRTDSRRGRKMWWKAPNTNLGGSHAGGQTSNPR